VTYQEMARYWPQSGEPQARPMNTLPKLAVSATLTEPVLEQRSLGRRAISIARSARSSSRPAARPVGSVRMARAMLGLGLVDRLRLMMFPELLGSGRNKAMFAGYAPTPLELHGTKVLGSQIVVPESRPAM